MTDGEIADASDTKLCSIWERSGACRKDALYIMRELRRRKLINVQYRFTVKALRLLGAIFGRWYCEKHGLDGRDIAPLKAQRAKPCSCPGRQER
jgi:hypothetical protein